MTVESTLPPPAPGQAGASLPPLAPGGAPLLGHAPQMLRDPLAFLTRLRDGGDVVRLRLGPKTVFAVCDPVLVEKLLKSPDFIIGGAMWDALEVLLGEGVASSNGQKHRRQRRAIQPAFRAERMADYASLMAEEAAAAADRWQDGQTVDINAEMFRVAARITARAMLHIDAEDDRSDRLGETMGTVFAGMYRRMILSFGPLYRLPLPANRRFERAMAELHRMVDEIVVERRAQAAEGIDTGDLLAALLDAHDDDGEAVTDQEIHDQVLALLLAGGENVSKTLAWTLGLLAEHPDHESRLYQEVESATGGDRQVAFGDLGKLAYMRNLLTESMRIRPSVWIFTRISAVDTTLGGYHIPAGTDIVYSPYAMQHDPRSFDDVDVFDPDRWLPERVTDVANVAHQPFGTGNRKCPGDHFSMVELSLILGTLVSRWRFETVPETESTAKLGITIGPKNGNLRVRARG
ncbi:cytochrome P450 [Streptomyces sp. UC4497]